MTARTRNAQGRFTKTPIAEELDLIDGDPYQREFEERFNSFEHLFGEFQVHRPWISFLAGCVTAFAGGWAGGIAAAYLATAALTLTGSAFIATLVLWLGYIASVYQALLAANKAALYVATGELDRDIETAKSWCSDKLGRAGTWFNGLKGRVAA